MEGTSFKPFFFPSDLGLESMDLTKSQIIFKSVALYGFSSSHVTGTLEPYTTLKGR
jgi:hypothetical protein